MGKISVTDCEKGQKVYSAAVVRSLSHGKPSHWINTLTVISPEHKVCAVGSTTMVISHEVFATKVEAIDHAKSLVAEYISELEAIAAELDAERLELVPIGKVA